MNPYPYVLNNPLKYVEPLGLRYEVGTNDKGQQVIERPNGKIINESTGDNLGNCYECNAPVSSYQGEKDLERHIKLTGHLGPLKSNPSTPVWKVKDEVINKEVNNNVQVGCVEGTSQDVSDLENYISRDDWGASPVIDEFEPEYLTENLADYYNSIVIHHSDRSANEDIFDFQEYFQEDREYADIAYHYVINGDGVIYEGRPIDIKGSHVALKNSNKIGVVLMGNFHNNSGIKGMPLTGLTGLKVKVILHHQMCK